MSAPGWGRCASHTGQAFSLVTRLVAFLTTRPVSVRLRGVASASSLPGHVKAPAEWPGLVDAPQADIARAAAAMALMRSGRKPDQWSSPATTTGACW